MNKILPIIGILEKPNSLGIFAVISISFFSFNYYTLSHLPASNGFMCLLAGSINTKNILFAGLISTMIALIFVALLEVRKLNKKRKNISVGSASGLGILVGTLTSFCTVCTLPILSLFGVGAFFAFISDYQIFFKMLSIIILGSALYILNKQLKADCKICKY